MRKDSIPPRSPSGASRLLRWAGAALAVTLLAPAPRPQAVSFTESAVDAGLIFQHVSAISPTVLQGGSAALDHDGDGDTDVFVVGGGISSDKFFVNAGNGTFTDQAPALGVGLTHLGGGVAVGDYDGDADPDMYVPSHGPTAFPGVGRHLLYRNDGGTGFTDVALEAGVHVTSTVVPDGFGAAFGDADLDGDLDLFVAGWRAHPPQPSGGNAFFRNQGDGTFLRADQDILVDFTHVFGYQPSFADMDGDGWPELLLSADFETSLYLVNNRDGTFSDLTASNGTGLDSHGMGHCVADVTNDGLLDWYVTSIEAKIDTPWGDASGNMLYLNQGGHQFVESSMITGCNEGGWGWGTVAVDVDHDGWVDLAETNGNRQMEPYLDIPNCLWRNRNGTSFDEIGGLVGFGDAIVGRGLLALDAEGDGDMDLVALPLDDRLHYYRNDLPGDADHSWLKVDLLGPPGSGVPTRGAGALIEVEAAGLVQTAVVQDGASYMSSSPRTRHFGLADQAAAQKVAVTWPDGTVRELFDVPAGQALTVTCCAGFTNLGGGLEGSLGRPEAGATGELEPGETVTLTLKKGLSSAATWLVIGAAQIDAPLKGGVLVPAPDFVFGGLLTNGAGKLAAPLTWPAGVPAGAALHVQFWLQDGGTSSGFSASNGVRITAP